ncbi:MAG TPA: DotU family type IV/VI secretion system protein [Longimicrobiales bacterium]
MSTATLAPPAPAATPAATPSGQHLPGELALVLQEAFTVAARLRSSRQAAPDAASFRQRVKQLLTAADEQARRAGYSAEYVRLAVYAYIAFLDESVLNCGLPIFAEWPRQPLQEEVFGEHMAGETFFRHLDELLRRQDSPDLADVLEVFLLCLLLGFKGKFSAGGQGTLHALAAACQEKILRIRGGRTELSPAWRPPADAIAVPRDPWVKRLAWAAVGMVALALVLFIVYKLMLHGGLSDIRALKAGLGG